MKWFKKTNGPADTTIGTVSDAPLLLSLSPLEQHYEDVKRHDKDDGIDGNEIRNQAVNREEQNGEPVVNSKNNHNSGTILRNAKDQPGRHIHIDISHEIEYKIGAKIIIRPKCGKPIIPYIE